MKNLRYLAIAVFLFTIPTAYGQSPRYEVGRHFRRFEDAWEKYGHDPAARKRIIVPMFSAFREFFALQWGRASQSLDKARHLLRSPKPAPDDVQWAESLMIQPKTRMLATSAKELPLELRHYYRIKYDVPKQAQLRISIVDGSGKELQRPWQTEVGKIPSKFKLPIQNLPQGDHLLRYTILSNKRVICRDEQGLSLVADLQKRLKALKAAVKKVATKEQRTDVMTVTTLTDWLDELAGGWTYETDYPAARLLRQCEDAVNMIRKGKRYFDQNHPGEYWLRLVTSAGNRSIRVMIPEVAKKGKPLPIVVALHGAGGSENLFFDGYGKGKIVEMCSKRGWLLVAPRSPVFSFRAPVAAIVDALAERYPVDKNRVFVIGHSMGAAQAVAAAQQTPGRFAAVAALGGSGVTRNAAKIKTTPFFVGVGRRDFAYEGAKRLASSLKKAGVKTVRLRIYPDIEHIVVVRVALPDVFRFFETTMKKRAKILQLAPSNGYTRSRKTPFMTGPRRFVTSDGAFCREQYFDRFCNHSDTECR